MRKTLTAILISVSLLMLDARMVVCRESVAAKQSLTAESSAPQQQSQSAQSGSAAKASGAQTSPVQLDERSRKIKRTVEKIGVAGRLTLYLKNGEELYGSVVRYDDESLQIAEVDLKQIVTVQYKNVKKVREDYGRPNILTGKRSNPSKGFKIGIAAAVFAFAIGFPILLLATSKD